MIGIREKGDKRKRERGEEGKDREGQRVMRREKKERKRWEREDGKGEINKGVRGERKWYKGLREKKGR